MAGPDGLVQQEATQVLGHRLGRGISPPRVLLDRLQDDRLEVARDAAVQRSGPRRLLVLDHLDQLQPVGCDERGPERHQLVQGQPQRVEIGAGVALAAEPLRRQVADRPQDVAGGRQAVVLGLGQAEVGDPDHAGVVQQQVRRLDVAVDDPPGVGVGQALRRLAANLRHAAEVRRPAAGEGGRRDLRPAGEHGRGRPGRRRGRDEPIRPVPRRGEGRGRGRDERPGRDAGRSRRPSRRRATPPPRSPGDRSGATG